MFFGQNKLHQRSPSPLGVEFFSRCEDVFKKANDDPGFSSRWWFQIFFGRFTPKIGEMIQLDEHNFSNGLKPRSLGFVFVGDVLRILPSHGKGKNHHGKTHPILGRKMCCGLYVLWVTFCNHLKQANKSKFSYAVFFEAFLKAVVIYKEMCFLKFHSDFGKRLLIVE